MKAIEKIGLAKFKVTTPGVVNSELELDFTPLIDQFNLSGNYFLIHWQAKPKGERQWGIYSSQDDSYRSNRDVKQNTGTWKSLQLDDKTAKTIPSAVLYVPAEKLNCINDTAIIGEVSLTDFN